MCKSFTLLSATLLSFSSIITQAQQLNTAKLDSLFNSLTANKKMMGSLALSQNGKEVYSRAFGYLQTDSAVSISATPTTRYRVGSISKVFTATMIFQLIEEKKLTLETPLATYFPQLPNAAAITVDQMLSHRSGLHSLTGDAAYVGYKSQPKTQAELLTLMAATKPDFEPGAKYAYSNTNFMLLGYIVEKLTRMPYAQALQKRIATKAGLKNTYYGGKIDTKKQEAKAYVTSATGWKASSDTDMSIPGGAGAVVSTPTDLNRFLEALFGGKLVSSASLEQMKTIRDGYGRGLMLLPFASKSSYGHGGSIDGFQSLMGYFPEDKLAVTMSTNARNYSLNEAMLGVLSIYFGKAYRIPNFVSSGFVPTTADLDRYVGTYASPGFPLKITISREGTILKAQGTGQSGFALEPVSKDVFKFDGAGVHITFDAAKPTLVLVQGGKSTPFTRE
jgi:CubicO group peptidase (beta-lactamase class C family)